MGEYFINTGTCLLTQTSISYLCFGILLQFVWTFMKNQLFEAPPSIEVSNMLGNNVPKWEQNYCRLGNPSKGNKHPAYSRSWIYSSETTTSVSEPFDSLDSQVQSPVPRTCLGVSLPVSSVQAIMLCLKHIEWPNLTAWLVLVEQNGIMK